MVGKACEIEFQGILKAGECDREGTANGSRQQVQKMISWREPKYREDEDTSLSRELDLLYGELLMVFVVHVDTWKRSTSSTPP